ncbi:MAG: extracellular solute-binding protein [Patescibacteria group bacterium]
MSNFRIIMTVFFGVFIVIGVIVFSMSRSGGGGSSSQEQITVWGTIPSSIFEKYMEAVNSNRASKLSVIYVDKDGNSFGQEFIEALANNAGPDVILLPQDLILRYKDKVYPIPYSSLSERVFKDTFIEEAELYLSSNGIIALPLSIDPLVMYWNRDIFTDALLAQAPSYWDEFFSLVSKITKSDSRLNILRSAVSLGEFRNVTNAKEILSLLILQAGNPIVKNNKGAITIALKDQLGFSIPPTEAALRFYTEFSNPAKESYSWNRSLPASRSYFLSGDLAIYFGYASEFDDLKLKNPNLNFDIAVVPQRRGGNVKTTFGAMQGFALVKSSGKLASAFNAIATLTGKDGVSAWVKASGLPPARRDLLSAGSNDSFGNIFYTSAIISKGWLDPNKDKTDSIFQDMIESTLSGKSRLSEAVSRADEEMRSLLSQ